VVTRGSVGRPRPRAGGFKAVSRAVVGGMKGHAGAWMFFGLVGTRFEALGEDLPSPTLRLESHINTTSTIFY